MTAPVMVLIFDRVFLYKPWREVWTERRFSMPGWLRRGSCWALILWSAPRSTVGFESACDALELFPQPGAADRPYLWLAVWPQALVLDYGLPRALTASPT